MRLLSLAAVLTLATAGTLWDSTRALGDSPVSDAAHACLQGPQIDFYEVVGATGGDSSPNLEFEGLAQGFDASEGAPYIVAPDHGACVSFVADNSKGSGSKDKQPYIKITLTEAIISG